MRIRSTGIILALLCSAPSIKSSDFDPIATISAIGLPIFGCLIGYGIHTYSQYKTEKKAEDAVTNLSNKIDHIQQRQQTCMNAWHTYYAASHDQLMQGLAGTTNAPFEDMRHTVQKDLEDLTNAYNHAVNVVDPTQYPQLTNRINEIYPMYCHLYGNLSDIHHFLDNHKFELQAYDALYRNEQLAQYAYHAPRIEHLISEYTTYHTGWPRINAREHLQANKEKLDRIVPHLHNETAQHTMDAQTYDQTLLGVMTSVQNNLSLSCQSLTNSPAYDMERERYREAERQRQADQLRQNQIDAEQKRKDAEERNRRATEEKTRAIEKNTREMENAQKLYQQLIATGYDKLPCVKRELDTATHKLELLRNQMRKNQNKVSIQEFDNIQQKLDTARSQLPQDPHRYLCISFNFNV